MSGSYPSVPYKLINQNNVNQLYGLVGELVNVTNSLQKGKINSTGSVSLTFTGSGTNTTTVTDALCTVNSIPIFVPTNLRGAKAIAALYVGTISNGSFVISWDETVATVTAGNPATLKYVLLG